MGENIFCTCKPSAFNIKNIKSEVLGTDTTNGRFGEVTIYHCSQCNKKWIHYFIEYESFFKSGRWFMGILTEKVTDKITPEDTIEYLESLDSYYFGGSYFNSTGKWGSGTIAVDS